MAKGKGEAVETGDMRWYVTLAKRQSIPNPQTSGEIEVIMPFAEVYCEITPMGNQTYLNGEQTDTPVTHEFVMRWGNYPELDMFSVIIRQMIMPDGSPRNELFRVRKIGNDDGRFRYIRLEIELEKVNSNVGQALPFP